MLEKQKFHRNSKKRVSKKQTDSVHHHLEVPNHLDHAIHFNRLNRVKGQIEGIEKMIQARRYCMDIIAQLRAASAALKAVEAEVLKSHLRGCVNSAFSGNDVFKSEEKIQEIIKLIC